MKLLMIDNYDSFTYNLVQYFGELGAEVLVHRNDEISLAEIEANPQLQSYALAVGQSVFGDNCATCHGTGGTGAKGYPNLRDDVWLWGGKLEDIQYTITHGIRTGAVAPGFADFAKRAFEGGWIEVEDRPGKRGGGFCADVPLSRQSRIFMTWGGSARSVATLLSAPFFHG
jgi:hypothetical protein